MYKVGDKLYVTKDEWIKMTSNGCGMCGHDIQLSDHDEAGWESVIINGDEQEWRPYCKKCTSMYFDGGVY